MDVDVSPKSMSLADWSRMLIDTATPGKADPRLPGLPPEDIQKLTNNIAGVATMQAAADIFGDLSAVIAKHYEGGPDPKVLDFGCGWGRIARFLPHLTARENIFGTDVDAGLIEACRAHLAPMNFEVMTSGEALPFADGQFDIVISNSVFSHLSEASHRFHVGEIARILRQGGLFLGTTLGTDSMQRMYKNNRDWIERITGPQKTVAAALERGEFVYASTGRWTDYGIAFTPEDWPGQNWQPEFEVIDTVGGAQLINVARRR